MLESREVIEQIIDWKAKQLSCSQVDNGALVEEVDSTFGHEAKAINHYLPGGEGATEKR